MSEATQTFYRERILAVLVHIQGNLDADLGLERLGAVAHFSPFHFHRLFTAFVGETVKEHIRRLRLERAAVQLKYGARGILPIALDAGFQSHEAFTRAFAAMFGCAPSRYRNSRERSFQTVPSGVHYAPHGDLRECPLLEPGACTMHVRIETVPAMHLAFIRAMGPYAQAAGSAWGQMFAWAEPRGLLGPQTRMIGICHDDPQVAPAERIRYDAALPVPDSVQAEGPVGIVDLAGGRHAVLTHRGPYEGLAESWNQLATRWFPQNGHEMGTTPSFEIYLNNPADTAPEDLLTDLFIPLAD